jgi:hypothetical protein
MIISIISDKNNLISFGFYKAFKTLYKDVFIIYYPSQFSILDKSNIIIINSFNNIEKMIISKNKKYVLLKKNEEMENILKKSNCIFYKIFEYDQDFLYKDYDMIAPFMYMKNNFIIMPYMSIYTKNEILFNYKNNILINKNDDFDKDKMIMIKNNNGKLIKQNKLPKLKIFNYLNNLQQKKLIEDFNIFVSFYNPNKFDYKSLSYMSLGSFSFTNSKLNKQYIPKTIGINFEKDIRKINKDSKKYQIKNIQEIYNNYTFEKYIKILNKFLI